MSATMREHPQVMARKSIQRGDGEDSVAVVLYSARADGIPPPAIPLPKNAKPSDVIASGPGKAPRAK